MSTVSRRPDSAQAPYFSVCIPQYNRTSFLMEACRSLQRQAFTDFEVCISDDCSTDGRSGELVDYLSTASFAFVYERQDANVRYDANLRNAIRLARGRFVFLLGNDDCLASPTVLQELHATLERHTDVCVAITNYADYESGQVFARVRRNAVVGSGPSVALSVFRNFSFVSGVIVRTAEARQHASCRWDGSEMYQMFLGSRIIANGGSLLYTQLVAVRKDIHIPDESVDSYAARPRLDPCPVVERRLPLADIGRVVADAIAPYESPRAHGRSIERIFRQLYAFTYPFWIVEYRKVQSWRYAVGVCLGLRPENSLADLTLPRAGRLRLNILFWLASVAALVVPERLLSLLRGPFYRAAKAVR